MRSRPASPLAFALSLALLVPLAAAGAEPSSSPPVVSRRPGVAVHAGLDAVYEGFAAGYRDLDPASVAALYTEGALYMPEGGERLQGREAIEANFRRFFDSVLADGATLAIRFEILSRTQAVGMTVDEGIYTLRKVGADGTEGEPSRGRFTVVAVRSDDDGRWRFHVDSFGPVDAADEPAAPAEAPAKAPADDSSDLAIEIRELRSGVWLHTSFHTFVDGTRFPSNGLAVVDGDGLFLVDTAWGADETAVLLERLEAETGRKVRRAVSTHFHDDRVGGAGVLEARGIEVMSHPRTPELARAIGEPVPDAPLAALAEVGGHVAIGPVEIFYPGAGHAEDDVVVWIPEAKVLYGGCAVRPGDTSSLGNTADAELASWPEAIRRVRARYPEAEVVVPGHGDPGGPELLDHTIALLEAHRPRTRPSR